MLNFFRRVNLGIFWSRETSTMKGILGYTKEIVRRAREGGRLLTLIEINDCPSRDKVGMGVAIQML